MKKVNGIWMMDDDNFFGPRIKPDLTFEFDKLKVALDCVTNWDCAIDGGGHYGTTSIALARQFKRVIAFEGQPEVYECFIENTNSITNIEPNLQAIGDRFDNVEISMRNKTSTINYGVGTFLGSGNIPMIPIDSLNIDSLGLLKLDIEGYELFALKGAEETLKRCHPVVIFEENRQCLPHGIDYGECGKYLESLGATFVQKVRADHIYMWK